MTKVWIITAGAYDDHRTVAVVSSEAAAKDAVRATEGLGTFDTNKLDYVGPYELDEQPQQCARCSDFGCIGHGPW